MKPLFQGRPFKTRPNSRVSSAQMKLISVALPTPSLIAVRKQAEQADVVRMLQADSLTPWISMSKN